MKTKKYLTSIVGTCVIFLTANLAFSEQLDLDDPDDVVRMSIRLGCSLTDYEPAVYWWEGRMYSRIPGEKDRHVFNVQGINVRHCVTLEDPVRGLGYGSISREIMLYLDPETNEVLRTWSNPWTGKEVEIIHVANDPPGNYRESWARDEEGNVTAVSRYMFKDGWMMHGGGAARLFYENPLAGDYQEYVGNWYHAMEFGSSATPEEDALDKDSPKISDRVISWGRVSEWLPWMEMGDKAGVVVFHTAGTRLNSWDDTPDVLKDEILANYPLYSEPPPMDYDKPRQTTWTVVRDHIDAKRAAEKKD